MKRGVQNLLVYLTDRNAVPTHSITRDYKLHSFFFYTEQEGTRKKTYRYYKREIERAYIVNILGRGIRKCSSSASLIITIGQSYTR